MSWLLTPEEIDGIIFGSDDNYVDGDTHQLVVKAQLRKVVEGLEGECQDVSHIASWDENLPENCEPPRRNCPTCWAEFVGAGKA